MGPQPCKCKEGREGSGPNLKRTIAMVSTVPKHTAAWLHAGAACVVWRCYSTAAAQKQVCCDISGMFFFKKFVSKKWAGGNGFPLSMPRMTQPCLLKWAKRQRGCKDRQEGWRLAQGAECGHCDENLQRHVLCAPCKVFVPAGFCLTRSTLQCQSYVLLPLSWYFILALGAAEIIKRPFRKTLKLSLKSRGECIGFF